MLQENFKRLDQSCKNLSELLIIETHSFWHKMNKCFKEAYPFGFAYLHRYHIDISGSYRWLFAIASLLFDTSNFEVTALQLRGCPSFYMYAPVISKKVFTIDIIHYWYLYTDIILSYVRIFLPHVATMLFRKVQTYETSKQHLLALIMWRYT